MFSIVKLKLESKIVELEKEIEEKNEIISELNDFINKFSYYINSKMNEAELIVVDLDKIIRCCEYNDKKPVICYRNAQYAKFKIKSSIASGKALLNEIGFDYIPTNNYTIEPLKIQEDKEN